MSSQDAETDDRSFLGGQLLLRQPRRGHRAGTDACLLAAALGVAEGDCVADVGAGVGAAGLAVLAQNAGTRGLLIERDPRVSALASHNVSANGLSGRARVVEVDVFDRLALDRAGLLGSADAVISNPPFYTAGTLRASSDPLRSRAHILDGGTLIDWMHAMVRIAKQRGRIALIHRPGVLLSLLEGWPSGWGAIRLCFVHSRMGEEAKRLILVATQGSRAPLKVVSPVFLHEANGVFTEVAEMIHRGSYPSSTKKAGSKAGPLFSL